MALSQSQKDAISKIAGGADILAEVDAIETANATFTETNRNLEAKNRKLTSEQVSRKRAMQATKEALKDAGLDPEGGEYGLEPETPLKEQLEGLTKNVTETVSKNVEKSPQYVALEKQVQTLTKKITDSDAKVAAAQAAQQVSARRSALQPLLPELFGKAAPYVLKTAMADGQIVENDAGEICIKDGDNLVPVSNVAEAATALKKLHADLVITSTRPGSGATPHSGGKAAGAKIMSSDEYNAKSASPAFAQELSKFFTEGGTIGE